MTFISQFYGKEFRWILMGLIALDVLSFVSIHTAIEPILALMVFVATIVVAIKWPSWLFPLAIAEIISTSNGHSLNIFVGDSSIGIRILIFIVLIGTTAVHVLKTRQESLPRSLVFPIVMVAILILLSTVQGLLAGHPILDIYKDANGYLAIGYIWAAYVWSRKGILKHRVLQAVGAGVTWIVAKSLLFVLMFGHLHPKTLDPIYLWIRDTRLGEVTLQVGNIYRVFLQSQWFIVPAILISGSYMLFSEKKDETGVRVVVLALLATLIASLSRSFWVGAIAGMVTLFVYVIIKKKYTVFVKTLIHTGILGVSAVAFLWVIVAIPIFQTSSTNIFASILRDRATQSSDVALDSRRQLVGPLLDSISESLVVGNGLGKNVVYKTQDPKYIEAHQTDIVSSYAFEWGWLDIMVKFGLVGFAFIIVMLFSVCRLLHLSTKTDKAKSWLYIGLTASLVALIVTHIFSPYLNHPIGWSTLAIIVAVLPTRSKECKSVRIQGYAKNRITQSASTSAAYINK